MKTTCASLFIVLSCAWNLCTAEVPKEATPVPIPAPSATETASPYISGFIPFSAKVGDDFSLDISLVPPSKTPVTIQMEPGDIVYSQSKFIVAPGERKFITGKAVKQGRDGLAWVHAFANGYQDFWGAVDVGFLGHLKLTVTSKLPYGVPSTETLALIDKDGKPLAAASNGLTIHVDSTDAVLSMGSMTGPLDIKLTANGSISPQFQVTPRNVQGGDLHLNATLMLTGQENSLDSEFFTLASESAWWLPILLAIGGGLLYGIYKALDFRNLPKERVALAVTALLVTSALAGFVGYLIANLDLLGLKLDPSVLRSYPLLGFLTAYIGIDVLVVKKMTPP